MAATILHFPQTMRRATEGVRLTTCEVAVKLCKKVGVRVLWRPGGAVNWMLPEMDAAEVVEE